MTVYVITHKHFNYQQLPVGYIPLLVGSNKNQNPDNFITDNTGDNITDKNYSYSELTGLYWMWKNTHDKNIGLAHYRRYFSEYTSFNQFYLTTILRGHAKPVLVKQLDEWINDGIDWVIAAPQVGGEGSLWNQFEHFHHIKDLEITRNVIQNLYPDYTVNFDQVIKDNSQASFYNMFYTKKKEMNAYCEWLFKILFEVEKQVDISSYDQYQQRLFGFLSERLFNVWLAHRQPKIKKLVEYNSDKMSRLDAARLLKHNLTKA